MTDEPNSLERRMAKMRPVGLGRDIVGRIAEELTRPVRPNWADRCLVGAMGIGAMAACLIVTMVVSSGSGPALDAGMASRPEPVRYVEFADGAGAVGDELG